MDKYNLYIDNYCHVESMDLEDIIIYLEALLDRELLHGVLTIEIKRSSGDKV